MPIPTYTPDILEALIGEVTDYVHAQRAHFGPGATPLDGRYRDLFSPFFPARILDGVRVFQGQLGTVADPPFAARARGRGFHYMPNYSHLAEITFGDVVVLQADATDRLLFHGLVHCVQYDMLGIAAYVDCYVRAFVRVGVHVLVPLEVHAFSLDQRFAAAPDDAFSVEMAVRRRIVEHGY